MPKYAIPAMLLALLLGVYSPIASADNQSPPASDKTASDKASAAQDGKTDTSACTAPGGCKVTSSDFVVTLDSNTLWRPRNGAVLFTVKSNLPNKQIAAVGVCFRWSQRPKLPAQGGDKTPSDEPPLTSSPLVSAISNNNGVAKYEAVVPPLEDAGDSWGDRALGDAKTQSIGLYTVPLAEMVVEIRVAGQEDKPVRVVVPVGITSVPYAIVLVILALVLFFGSAWLILRAKQQSENPPAIPAPKVSLPLRIITTSDGYGSLSQFQIILWTLVVGASAVYVIVLSGNLINITDGTLILLGIAGGTAVLGRIPVKQGGDPAAAPVPAPHKAGPPSWSDLVTDGDSGIDVTRIQMLVFTLITAVFVTLKVVVGYEIPEIPANFLLLMGISNGVYLTGKHLPDKKGG
jgi:hypothetical protein